MYVIFPADEVVYLSYGRIIYVPSLPQSRPETRTSLSTGSHASYPSVPSTSTSSTKSRRSTASEPIYALDSAPLSSAEPNLVESSRSLNQQPAANRDQAPVKPERKKRRSLKLTVPNKNPAPVQRKLSYSDFLSVNRDKSPKNKYKQKSDNYCDPSPAVVGNSSEKSQQTHRSGLLNKFNRGKSVSPRLGRDRTPFDFESLNYRERSHSKSSVRSCSPYLSPAETNKPGTFSEKSSPTKKKTFFGSVRVKRTPDRGLAPSTPTNKMAANDSALKDLTHPGYNEPLKSHNAVTFKLVRTVSDFTQQLGQMYEQHAEELQMLVANFRKRNGELRKERPACASSLFHTWETLLQEVEIDSQALGDIASILGRQVSRPLLERSFHRKIQSRKVFTHKESYETIITKTEEKLAKCRQEYKNAYLSYLAAPSTDSLSAYFNSHNAYVQQLHATNGMLEEYGKETLPSLLQELEEIYTDLCSTITDGVLQGAEVVSSRAMEQCRRYDGLISQCKSVSGPVDLAALARSLPVPQGRGLILKRPFVPPQPPPPPEDGEPQDIPNENIPPPLKDELVIDRLSAVQVKPSHDALRKEALDLESQIRGIQDALDTLLRIQQRSVDASLYNKANELQEDISMKRFDLRVARIHLSAINAQKELFTNKLEGETGRERKMSSASTGSMKNKWLKAFKSLKTPPPEPTTEKKNGAAATRELLKGDPDAHNFQENTYKKITPCDVCSQVLRGHTRQGLKCRICKMNVHLDCQDKASKCQTKARLLRRQKSTSEIETRVPETTVEEEKVPEMYSGMTTINRHLSIRDTNRLYPPNAVLESPEVDQIYQVLKQATEISNSKPRVNVESAPPGITVDRGATGSNPGSSGSSGQSLNRRGAPPPQPTPRIAGSTLAVINPAPCSTSSDRRHTQNAPLGGSTGGTPESSSMRRRLFAGMKSLTGFGSRSRHGSPGHRSISLPEKRNSQDASGTRPFGQPLCIGPQFQNGNGQGFDLLPPTPPSPSPSKGSSMRPSTSAVTFSPYVGTNNVAPHSPRRQKLNLRMKSLSLDSPESTEHVQRRKHHGVSTASDPHSNQSSSSRIQSPSSPVHNRRLLSAKNIRMSSVELPDDNEKSPSSASTSPCPSPVGGKKSHRLLPTNLYVVLYNFKSRHQDELDLKAGYKVTVIDTSDPDWWKGKCLGRVGFFPSKYVSKLSPGEKPLQVTHNLQVSDGDNGLMLLRDQIVIQIGEELDGMVMIRSGDNRQGVCPVKFLQEV